MKIIGNIFLSTLIIACVITQIMFFLVTIPVQMEDVKANTVSRLISAYHISERMASLVYRAHVFTGYDPILIAELILSESRFNNKAISSAGYKGILQTPSKTGYVEADLLHGLAILESKIKEHPGDLESAIAAYKGGAKVPAARTLAKEFLKDYRERKLKI